MDLFYVLLGVRERVLLSHKNVIVNIYAVYLVFLRMPQSEVKNLNFKACKVWDHKLAASAHFEIQKRTV